MPLIILTGGLLASGKDAFADHLVARHHFKKLGMSDTLAEALYTLNPIIDAGAADELDVNRYQEFVSRVGYVEAKKHPEVRRLLQVLGTEVGRKLLGEYIWVEAAQKKILELVYAGHNVVITGVRFPNELQLEHDLNDHLGSMGSAVSVWVRRKGWDENPAQLITAHASEASVRAEDFQYVLNNDSDLTGLYKAADDLLVEIQADYL